MNIFPKIIELKGPDAETAFLEAQREARHTYGHNGSTGTIADSSGCAVIPGNPLLPWDCRRAAQQFLRDGRTTTNGTAYIFSLTNPKKTRTIKVPVDITGLTPGKADDAVDTAVRTKLPTGWGIQAIEIRDHNAEGPERKGTLRAKPTITVANGPKITRYIVRNSTTGEELTQQETLPEAKKWMKAALRTNPSTPMHCIAITTRADGPLITGTAEITRYTVIAVATIGIPDPAGNSSYLAAAIFNA
jgi:hypothetical protein